MADFSSKIPFGSSFPEDNTILPDHKVLGFDPTDNKNKAFKLSDLKEFFDVGETELLDPGTFSKSTPTSSSLSGVSFVVLGSPFSGLSKSFTTQGTPSAGNNRWEVYYGDSSGDMTYLAGTEAPDAVKPIPPSDTVVIREILRTDTGEDQEVIPGSSFPSIRFKAEVTENSDGKFSKIMEFTASPGNTYAFSINYMSFSADPAVEGHRAAGSMYGTILVDGSASLKFGHIETHNSKSDHGDFVVQEETTGVFSLYHKSNAYWDRTQFRVVFTASSLPSDVFVSGNGYEALPGSPVNKVDSIAAHLPVIKTSAVISFDHPSIHGSSGSPITSALTEDTLEAKPGTTSIIFHNAGSSPIPGSWVQGSESSTYSGGVLNVIKVTYYSDSYIRYVVHQDV